MEKREKSWRGEEMRRKQKVCTHQQIAWATLAFDVTLTQWDPQPPGELAVLTCGVLA